MASGKPKPAHIWPTERRPWLAFWRDHFRVFRDSAAFLTRSIAGTMLVWLLIGFSLALPSGLYLIDLNLANAAGQWQGQAGLSVYFLPAIDDQAPKHVAQRLTNEAGIDNVRLITPDEALAEFRQRAGLADSLDQLEENPLPATIRATANLDTPGARLEALAHDIRGESTVDEVVVERVWLERLSTIREVVQRLSWMTAVLVCLGGILVSSASVRLAIEGRLAELQVLVLVGASRRFIRRPFLYLGVVYGTGGAVVAAMLISAMLLWLEPPLIRLFESYGSHLELVGFDPIFLLVLLASGVILGVLGARTASNQRLKHLTVT